MSELRQRQTTKPSHEPDAPQPKRQSSDDEDKSITLLDIIRMIAVLAIGFVGLSYYMTDFESALWGYRPWYSRWPVVKQWVVRNIDVNTFLPSIPHMTKSRQYSRVSKRTEADVYLK